MNNIEEQTDCELLMRSIIHNEQSLHVISQVSLDETAPNVPLVCKDPLFYITKEKKIRKIDHLKRSLLIQGLPNDFVLSLTVMIMLKSYGGALERQMCGSKYGKQYRKAAILYEYETFKAIERKQLLDTYIRFLQVINDLKKREFKKDIYELNYKFLNNQNQGDLNEVVGLKKKEVVVVSDLLALVVEKTKVSKSNKKVVVDSDSEESDDENIKNLKKITTLSAKAFYRKKYYAKPTNNNLITSSTSTSANKEPEYVKQVEKTKYGNKKGYEQG
uniref:Uncharacterized protein n=1 Tax=Tanacetum cinerariifolium TaxID=118510 RepID=A0A6L2M0J4_TANCI|nr:hypothetical protein [Tanacetum cinerariifolium]